MTRHVPISAIGSERTRRSLRAVVKAAVREFWPEAREEQVEEAVNRSAIQVATPRGFCTCDEGEGPDYCPVHAT